MNNSSTTLLATLDKLCNVSPVLWSFTGIIFLTGVIANGLLLFAMIKDPLKCFRTPTSYFIGNLASHDIFFLCLTAELTTMSFVQLCIRRMNFFDVRFKISVSLVQQGYFLSFPSILSVALERYLAIAFPLWHKVHVTPHLCGIWIAGLWFFVVAYYSITAGLLFSGMGNTVILLGKICFTTLMLATPLVYLAGFFSIRRQRLRLKDGHPSSEVARQAAKARLKTENRFLSSICIINCCLLSTSLPLLIMYLDGISKSRSCRTTETVCNLINFLFLLNFVINPFFYTWRFPKYRKTFLTLYCRCFRQ